MSTRRHRISGMFEIGCFLILFDPWRIPRATSLMCFQTGQASSGWYFAHVPFLPRYRSNSL